VPLEYRRTLSLRVHERAGNHEEFQLKVDYIGICKKARIFLLSFFPRKKVLVIGENFLRVAVPDLPLTSAVVVGEPAANARVLL
jgi:hypothetical protein